MATHLSRRRWPPTYTKEEMATHLYQRGDGYPPISRRRCPPTFLSRRTWPPTYISGTRQTPTHLGGDGHLHQLFRRAWAPIYLLWSSLSTYLPTYLSSRRWPPIYLFWSILSTYLPTYPSRRRWPPPPISLGGAGHLIL